MKPIKSKVLYAESNVKRVERENHMSEQWSPLQMDQFSCVRL